eukprot:4934497-Pyramimonas_sp.AAC.1
MHPGPSNTFVDMTLLYTLKWMSCGLRNVDNVALTTRLSKEVGFTPPCGPAATRAGSPTQPPPSQLSRE